jgi:hypothetical protein
VLVWHISFWNKDPDTEGAEEYGFLWEDTRWFPVSISIADTVLSNRLQMWAFEFAQFARNIRTKYGKLIAICYIQFYCSHKSGMPLVPLCHFSLPFCGSQTWSGLRGWKTYFMLLTCVLWHSERTKFYTFLNHTFENAANTYILYPMLVISPDVSPTVQQWLTQRKHNYLKFISLKWKITFSNFANRIV